MAKQYICENSIDLSSSGNLYIYIYIQHICYTAEHSLVHDTQDDQCSRQYITELKQISSSNNLYIPSREMEVKGHRQHHIEKYEMTSGFLISKGYFAAKEVFS